MVNYDLPNIPESYVHRIGRTARAGAEGVAISFCDHEERAYLRDIERLIRMTIPATDRRTGKPTAHAAPQQAEARHGGRPHRGNAISAVMAAVMVAVMAVQVTTATGPITAAMAIKTVRARTVTAAHRQDATAGEPSGIGNVTFMQRPNEPRRNAGHRRRVKAMERTGWRRKNCWSSTVR